MKKPLIALLGTHALTGCVSNATHKAIEPVTQVEYTDITKRMFYLSCDTVVNDKNIFLGTTKVSVRDMGQKFHVKIIGNEWLYGPTLTKRNDDGSVSFYDKTTGETFFKSVNSKSIYYYLAIPSRNRLIIHIDCRPTQQFPIS